ncbi:hypothetical protein F5876DRAFT_62226 [Lentinula aff. lateritia]|uniref:Uncharacterized protein n=1 Tax=Lentinula aff. lateritia TaxID=2804960 RepID=A0ACC1UCL4_9AGAR|nr:hypothetical protein F5876DRAFT_62226 [Lentinula aff. lateritia]
MVAVASLSAQPISTKEQCIKNFIEFMFSNNLKAFTSNHLFVSVVPQELKDLTVVEEAMISHCRAKSTPSRKLCKIEDSHLMKRLVVLGKTRSKLLDGKCSEEEFIVRREFKPVGVDALNHLRVFDHEIVYGPSLERLSALRVAGYAARRRYSVITEDVRKTRGDNKTDPARVFERQEQRLMKRLSIAVLYLSRIKRSTAALRYSRPAKTRSSIGAV